MLDIFDVHHRADDVPWAMRPLDEATVQEKFGTLTPTREQFGAVYETDELFCERGSCPRDSSPPAVSGRRGPCAARRAPRPAVPR